MTALAAPAIAPATRVLVVDDDVDHVELVRRALRRHAAGFEVTHARDGVDCLAALTRGAHDLVLLDYGLPRMNGLEVLARIRALTRDVPVLMATSQGDEQVAVEAMRAGAVDYVVKTTGYLAALPTVLSKVLQQHALLRDYARLYEETRQQQTRLQQIFDSTSEGIVLVEADGRVSCANRRAADLLGFAPEGEGQRLAALLGLAGEAAEGDLEVGAAVLHWTARPTRDPAGPGGGLTVTLRDVTREREVSRLKSDFVSFVAHQLRTPLSGIRWSLELTAGEEMSPTVRSCVEDAAASALRLIEMVGHLLDISRLESGSGRFETTEACLGAVTGDVLAGLEATIALKGQRLTVDLPPAPPRVLADGGWLRRALLSLAANAVTYTPAGGAITVRVAADATEARWTIEDTGIGIPPAAGPRLFEKFFRADNAVAVETEGTGLGLCLAKLIVERLGGRISWTSTEGLGTAFTVALPLAPSRAR